MTELRHFDHDERARFVTVSTHHRLPILSSAVIRNIAVEHLVTCCRQDQVRLLAYGVMPEHVHFVAIPPIELKFGPFVGRFKMRSSTEIHSLYLRLYSPLVQQAPHTLRFGTVPIR